MKVVVAGGTGLIGRAVCGALLSRLDGVSVLTRNPQSLPAELFGRVAAIGWEIAEPGDLAERLEGAHAVVNLAGESIAGGRWTEARKERITASRLQSKRRLVEALSLCRTPPKVLLSASAVGYYGDRGDQELDEQAGPGEGFLARLCVDWEGEANNLLPASCREVLLRIGVVLDPSGGALAAMLPVFRLGLGGAFGRGRQWMSWIHRGDLTRLILFLIDHPDARGPVNATSPEPVRNRDFAHVLANVLRRPSLLRVPRFALRLALGELGESLLAGQRVLPTRARQLGFSFEHPGLRAALRDLLRGGLEARMAG